LGDCFGLEEILLRTIPMIFGITEHTAKASANPEALAKFKPGQN